MKTRYMFLGCWIFFVFCMLFLAREVKLSHDFFENYAAKNYTQAQKDLEKKYWNTAVDFHNLGNTQYFLSLQDETQKKYFLESALKSYEVSLDRREHLETRANYDYIQKLLDEGSQKISQKQQSNTPEDLNSEMLQQQENGAGSASGSTGENQKQETENPEQNQEKNAPIQNARGEQYTLSQNQELENLSPEEREAMEQLIEQLKQEQAKNQGLFGKKVPEKTEFEKRFESLFGGNEEKDW